MNSMRVEVASFVGMVNIKMVGNPCVVGSITPDEAERLIEELVSARDVAREWTARVDERMKGVMQVLAPKGGDRG